MFKHRGAARRAWPHLQSLPEALLDRFETETANFPRTTEAERMVIQRIGQDVFRGALMNCRGKLWSFTVITEPGLLRASRVKLWANCIDLKP